MTGGAPRSATLVTDPITPHAPRGPCGLCGGAVRNGTALYPPDDYATLYCGRACAERARAAADAGRAWLAQNGGAK